VRLLSRFYEKILIIVTLVFTFNTLLYNIAAIITPDASASLNSTVQGFNDSISQNATNRTNVTAAQVNQTLAQVNQTLAQVNQTLASAQIQANQTLASAQIQANQTLAAANVTAVAREATKETITGFAVPGFASVIGSLIFAIAIFIVVPLVAGMLLTYRQGFRMNQLYRVLVAIGVIFTVILIVVFLNSLIAFNISAPGTTTATLLETQKNFLTIIATAFASLVAFYFGTRGTQSRNAERTTTITGHEIGQKALEVVDVNPIDGTVGVEVDSPVTATFSASVRSSTINANTFSVKDASGNPVQGKITLTDNNTTIRFNPVPPFNRNSRYTVTITKGIIDISGASLAAEMEWHFTTVT
jgi:Bacterial Ig-like domain